MIIYSEVINLFLSSIRKVVREILATEIGVTVQKTRFSYGRYTYPINIVVFERRNLAGYFDCHNYQIGIQKNFLNIIDLANNGPLKNVIRHELGHFFTYIKYGNNLPSHGEKFREVCKGFGWGKEVYQASFKWPVNGEEHSWEQNLERTLRKVKKLLALSGSSNIHESQSATIKANEILLKYNLNNISQNEFRCKDGDELVCMERVLEGHRVTAKHRTISKILDTFQVSSVFNKGNKGFYLEVIGNSLSVELANYVASYLDRELEVLWDLERKKNPHLRGVTSKNSFMRGVGEGFVKGIMGVQDKCLEKDGLILLERSKDRQLSMVYPKLSTLTSRAQGIDREALKIGKNRGENLKIRSGISNENKGKRLLDYITN